MSWPLNRIAFCDGPIAVPQGTEALVFTSTNGVRAFAAKTDARDLPVICVGERTTAQAKQAGFREASVGGKSAGELLHALPRLPYRRLFYARGRDVSTDLKAGLPPDFTLFEQVVYAAEPAGPPESKVAEALANGRIAVITIWSRRNAQVLEQYLTNSSHPRPETVKLAAISGNAAEPLAKAGFRAVLTAPSPDADGMMSAIFAALRQESHPR